MKIVYKPYRIASILSLACLMQKSLYSSDSFFHKPWVIFPWKDVGKKDASLVLCAPTEEMHLHPIQMLRELWKKVYKAHFTSGTYEEEDFTNSYIQYCVTINMPSHLYDIDTYAEATGPRIIPSHPDYTNKIQLQRQHSALSLFLFEKIRSAPLIYPKCKAYYIIFFIPERDIQRITFTQKPIPQYYPIEDHTHDFTWGQLTGEYIPRLFDWDAILKRYPTITSSFLSWQERVTKWAYICPHDSSGWEGKPRHFTGTLSDFIASSNDTPEENGEANSLLKITHEEFQKIIPDNHPLLPNISSIVYEYYNPLLIIQFPTEIPLACEDYAASWPCANPYHCKEQYFRYSTEGRSLQGLAPCPCIYCTDKNPSHYPEPIPLPMPSSAGLRNATPYSLPNCSRGNSASQYPASALIPPTAILPSAKCTKPHEIKKSSLPHLVVSSLALTTTIYVSWKITVKYCCHDTF